MKKQVALSDYKCNQLSISKLFADLYGNRIRYNVDSKKFSFWDEHSGIWKNDDNETVGHMVEEFLLKDVFKMVKEMNDKSKESMYTNYFKTLQNNSGVEGIQKVLKRNIDIQVRNTDYDNHSRYLNCLDATFDLDISEIVQHEKSLLISKQCNVMINKKSRDNTWRDFLMDIVKQDEEQFKYLLRMIDYIMRGKPTDDCMFIFYGPTTRNGKSTFVNALTYFMGTYAITAKPEDISKGTRTSSGPRPELIRLKGKRLISIGEASNNQRLDVAIIKSLTGGDTITARKLYSDYEEFVNQGVFILHTNYLPIVDDDTLFQSNRVIVIPFDAEFRKDEIDTEMYSKLIKPKALTSLFYLIDDIREEYYGVGIKEDLPQRVIEATELFANQTDFIKWFIKDNIVHKDGSFVFSKDIYIRYRNWKKDKEAPDWSNKALTTKLKQKGLRLHRRNSGTGFKGVTLI